VYKATSDFFEIALLKLLSQLIGGHLEMNKQEAWQLIRAELSVYEGQPYADFVRLIDKELILEKQGPGGTKYQIEILIFWDSTPNGVIRVISSIDDGGWRAFFPLTESILKYPE
jgi:hypothetical protein